MKHTTSTPSAFVPAGVPRIGTGRTQHALLSRSADVLAMPPAGSAPASAPAHLTQALPQRESGRAYPDGGAGCGKGTVVVQFRADLRVHDHAALSHALEEGARVVPVYVFDTRQFGATKHGFQRTGKYRARFLIESVTQLRSTLESLGGGLLVRVGIPEDIIPSLCRAVGGKRVFLHKEINYEEQESDRMLEETLQKAGGTVQRFWSNTLYYEDDLPFPIADMPDVYTDFREAVQARSQVRQPLQAPDRLPALPRGIDQGEIPTLADLGITASFTEDVATEADEGGVGRIVGGEVEAMRRLRAYAEERQVSALEYASEGDVGYRCATGPDFSCRISPWLSLGCLSPRAIFEEMKRTAKTPELMMQGYTYYELVWRDFFRCITAKYSKRKASAEAVAAPVAAAAAL